MFASSHFVYDAYRYSDNYYDGVNVYLVLENEQRIEAQWEDQYQLNQFLQRFESMIVEEKPDDEKNKKIENRRICPDSEEDSDSERMITYF